MKTQSSDPRSNEIFGGSRKPAHKSHQLVPVLIDYFLSTIEEAIEIGLFGPKCDHVLVTLFCKGCQCQGAHGSLHTEEMHIPFFSWSLQIVKDRICHY